MNRPVPLLPRISRRHFLRNATLVGVGIGVSTFSLACGAAPATVSPQPTAAPKPSGASAVAPTSAAAPAQAPAAPRSSTLRIALQSLPTAIDALRHFTTADQNIFFNLYDPLVDLDPKLAVRPRLAESWSQVDSTTWRFKLRQGVKFSNGEDFTAENVKYTFEQYVGLQPPYVYVSLWGAGWPPSVEIENAQSVLIKTPKPQPSLPRLITRFGMLPLEASKAAGYADKPIGTGPFKLVEWKKGQQLVLESNPTHWRGAPKISQLVWQPIPDQSARVAALQAGEIDLIWDVPYDRATELSSKFTTLETPPVGLASLNFNFRVAKSSPIADVRVRKALTYAVDGPAMVDALLSGKGTQSKGPAPLQVVGGVDAGGYPVRNVDTARNMLKDAGHANGIELNVIHSAGQFPKDLEIVEALIGQLGEAGVNVKFEQLDSGQLSQRLPTPNWDVRSNSGAAFTGEGQWFANQVKGTVGYSSATVDQTLEQADLAGDTPQRVELVQQALKAMWQDVPYLWSFDRVLIHGMTRKLQGIEIVPLNWVFFQNAQLSD